MGCLWRQVSWLTAQAFNAAFPDSGSTRLASEVNPRASSGICAVNSPLTVAGAAAELANGFAALQFPFHLARLSVREDLHNPNNAC